MDASRSASVSTFMLAERGGCGLISGLLCKAVSPAALMVSVIDASSPQRARSSRDRGEAAARPFHFMAARRFSEPAEKKWAAGHQSRLRARSPRDRRCTGSRPETRSSGFPDYGNISGTATIDDFERNPHAILSESRPWLEHRRPVAISCPGWSPGKRWRACQRAVRECHLRARNLR